MSSSLRQWKWRGLKSWERLEKRDNVKAAIKEDLKEGKMGKREIDKASRKARTW
jgi:hypothetical protein